MVTQSECCLRPSHPQFNKYSYYILVDHWHHLKSRFYLICGVKYGNGCTNSLRRGVFLSWNWMKGCWFPSPHNWYFFSHLWLFIINSWPSSSSPFSFVLVWLGFPRGESDLTTALPGVRTAFVDVSLGDCFRGDEDHVQLYLSARIFKVRGILVNQNLSNIIISILLI